MESFINRVRKHQTLNQEIFTILNKYLKPAISNSNDVNKESSYEINNEKQDILQQNIHYYHPPTKHDAIL